MAGTIRGVAHELRRFTLQDKSTTPDTIPYGYCHCGCGEQTTVAQKTDRRAGQVRGEPIRFRPGHNTKKMPVVYVDGDTKACSKCKAIKDVANFPSDKSTYDGIKAYCIDCGRVMAKAWRDSHKDEIREKMTIWREENADRLREYGREYSQKNADVISIKRRAYNRKNAERASAIHRLWRERNPDCDRIRCQNRRARKKMNGGSVSRKEWERVMAKFDGKCARCGASDHIQMDHVVPLAKGGRHSVDNIQPLCGHCNMSKHTKIQDYRGKMYRPAALPLDDISD